MDTIPSDLQGKYQKLATEYSKIRAQASVLKKAVIDEQAKTSELKELLKEREQCLRKADQEMESINFRNQQLTKRVVFLQEELELLQKTKKSKQGTNEQTDSNTFFDQELEKQITQNARLMFQLQEREEEHQKQSQQLMERVQNLERDIQQYQRSNTDVEAKYRVKLDELLNEKTTLKEKIQDRERDIQQYNAQVAALQLQLERLKTDLGNKLQTASELISTRLPFIDSKKSELNELNIPTYNKNQQIWSIEIINQVGKLINDLTNQLSDFHTYTEQRLHVRLETTSPVTTKFSVYLKENAKYLRGVYQGYKDFQNGLNNEMLISLETIPSLFYFADKLNNYICYLQKLLPYQILSLEEENSLFGDEMEIYNKNLIQQLSRFTSSFIKLNNYVSMLSLQSKKTKQHSIPCQKRFLEELIVSLEEIYNRCSDLLEVFRDKSEYENTISNDKIISTNECLINSLTMLVNSSKEVYTILFDNKKQILKDRIIKSKSNKSHPSVSHFNMRATSYLKSLHQNEPESVPYEDALRNKQESNLSSGNSKKALGDQLECVQQRATQLEQDCEKWRHEYQLMQMKLTKEKQSKKELEEQLSRSSTTTPQSEDSIEQKSNEPSPAHNIASTPQITSGMLGQLTSLQQIYSNEADLRENEVKNYFSERINQLVAERQLSEGKAVSLKAECLAIYERLKIATDQLEITTEQRKIAENTVGKLQEELHTTTSNYESQLSTMSDHLAHMNEKLTVQKDEIDQLKYQLGQKVPKKGKQK